MPSPPPEKGMMPASAGQNPQGNISHSQQDSGPLGQSNDFGKQQGYDYEGQTQLILGGHLRRQQPQQQ